MILRSILLACAVLAGAATAAQAVCATNDPNWPARNVRGAQKLARLSDYRSVRAAYAGGTCTITSLVHQSGRPCPTTNNNNHTSVTVVGKAGTYHVFTTRLNNNRYCTTH